MRFFFPGTRAKAIWQPFCLFSPKRQVRDTLKQHFMQPTSHEPRTRYRHHRSPYRSGQQCILMSRKVEHREAARFAMNSSKQKVFFSLLSARVIAKTLTNQHTDLILLSTACCYILQTRWLARQLSACLFTLQIMGAL